MKTQYILSWILRGLGALAVLVYFFGAPLLCDWFPGLIGKSINPIFYSGILLYVCGAVYYRILYRKEMKARRQAAAREKSEDAIK